MIEHWNIAIIFLEINFVSRDPHVWRVHAEGIVASQFVIESETSKCGKILHLITRCLEIAYLCFHATWWVNIYSCILFVDPIGKVCPKTRWEVNKWKLRLKSHSQISSKEIILSNFQAKFHVFKVHVPSCLVLSSNYSKLGRTIVWETYFIHGAEFNHRLGIIINLIIVLEVERYCKVVDKTFILELPHKIVVFERWVFCPWLKSNETRITCFKWFVFRVLDIRNALEMTLIFDHPVMFSQLEMEYVFTNVSFKANWLEISIITIVDCHKTIINFFSWNLFVEWWKGWVVGLGRFANYFAYFGWTLWTNQW